MKKALKAIALKIKVIWNWERYWFFINQTLKDDGTTINFDGNDIFFECHYARNVDVSPIEFEVLTEPQTQSVVGFGSFEYEMIVNTGNLGRQTEVQIIPNHGFTEISAK